MFMPNKLIENGRVPRVKGVDKRLRLTPEQRAEIRENAEGLSNYQLAAKYGVSKRLVQFIRRPEAHRDNLLRREERGGTMRYYDREKHAESIAAHRKHKQDLLEKGELILERVRPNGEPKVTYIAPQLSDRLLAKVRARQEKRKNQEPTE